MNKVKNFSKRIVTFIAIEVFSAISQWIIGKYLDENTISNNIFLIVRYILIGVAIIALAYIIYMLALWVLNNTIDKRLKYHSYMIKNELLEEIKIMELEKEKDFLKYKNITTQKTMDDLQLIMKYMSYRFEKHHVGGSRIVSGNGKPDYIQDLSKNFNQNEVKRLVELRAILESVDYNSF